MPKIKCACRGAYLDKLIQPAILLELKKQEQYAPDLYKSLNALSPSQSVIDPTGFYRTLKKMEEAGNITSQWDLTHGPKPVRRYCLTPLGLACLKNWKTTLAVYRENVDTLLQGISAVL